MPTPAAGSELIAAITTGPQVTLSALSARPPSSTPVQRLRAWRGSCAPRRCSRSARPGPARRCAAAPWSRSRSASAWRSSSASTRRPRARSRPAPCWPASPASTPRPGRAPPGRRRPRRRSAWPRCSASSAARPRPPRCSRWACSAPLAGYCFAVLAAAGDRRPLGGALAGHRPGLLPRPLRRRLGAALRHRRRPPAGCLVAGRSGSSSTAPPRTRRAAGTPPRPAPRWPRT